MNSTPHDIAVSASAQRMALPMQFPATGPRRTLHTPVLIILAMMLSVDVAHAMGKMLHGTEGLIYRCRVDRVEARYTGDAHYSVWGTCHAFESSNTTKDQWNQHPESTFGNEQLVGEVKWEGKGKYLPQSKTAEETITVLKRESPRADVKSFSAAGRISATLQCENDPWLAMPKGGCQIKFLGGDSVGRLWEKELYAANNPVPASSSLPSERRAELKAQLQRAQAVWHQRTPGVDETSRLNGQVGFARSGAEDAATISTARSNAPTINAPLGTIFEGRGMFKITPSKFLNGTHALIQLNWLDAPPDKQRDGLDRYQYEVPLKQIASAAGMPAPHNYLGPGTWEMRVRINQPKAGEWSLPKRFQVMANPAAATLPAAGLRTGPAEMKSAGPGTNVTPAASATTTAPAAGGVLSAPQNAPQGFEGRH